MRIDKQNYYLNIAAEVARRGTCLRRNSGAVIVNDDEIIATGYTGASRGAINCIDIGRCRRDELGVKSGERYELCRSVHAEMNACVSACRKAMQGGTLYLATLEARTGKLIEKTAPCLLCKRVIVNAGIRWVVTPELSAPGGTETYFVHQWVEEI